MKNLITLAVAVLIAAIAFPGRAIIVPPQGSIPAPVPEPTTLTLLLASAFALCLLKDRKKLN